MSVESLFAPSTAPVRRGLRDDVYDRVLELLLSGALPPGARLGIDRIATSLEVSPTPVREALVLLERTGLVTRELSKGYRVAEPLTIEQINELFDARLILEVGAMELAERRPEGLHEALSEAQLAHERAARDLLAVEGALPVAVVQAYFAADVRFHDVVREFARNHFVSEMSVSLSTHLHRMRQTLRNGQSDVEFAIAEHKAIVDAIASGEPGAGVAAMREHITLVRGRARADAD
ncbi:MAG: GntR family transcriptional regulator [Microbacteriaceae bacterium]